MSGEVSTDVDTDNDKPRKRKKASRACNHCQSAHLTCDDNRPCLRCVKRNLGETCQDGVRKKAKYLRDIDDDIVNLGQRHPTHFHKDEPAAEGTLMGAFENNERQRPDNPKLATDDIHVQEPTTSMPSAAAGSTANSLLQPSNKDLGASSELVANAGIVNASISNATGLSISPFDAFADFTSTGEFGSHSTNLEYAVLSSMLQYSEANANLDAGLFGQGGLLSPSQNTGSASLFPSISTGYNGITGGSFPVRTATFGLPLAAFERASDQADPTCNANKSSHSDYPATNNTTSSTDADYSILSVQQNTFNTATDGAGFTGSTIDHDWAPAAEFAPAVHPSQAQLGRRTPSGKSGPSKAPISAMGTMRVEDVYKYVDKPYNHLEGYHVLIKHLQTNFKSKGSILRIIRALSIYRPSLIALQMRLTLEDEVFLERSFQRTLIELEKLISFSGTPTVVWRRTGEIVLVGTEFLMLSEWKREELLGIETVVGTSNDPISNKAKRKYIFEVLDEKATVDYYETFAAHAFESSSSTIASTCNVITPAARKVSCTFGYNFKRDIFGLPSMIIGQFLPILSNSVQ